MVRRIAGVDAEFGLRSLKMRPTGTAPDSNGQNRNHLDNNFRCSLNARTRSRRSRHVPPRYALCATMALPSRVLGPVDFSQGRHSRISSAWRARRSDVQPFAIILLQ